jgi:hypothetical protein
MASKSLAIVVLFLVLDGFAWAADRISGQLADTQNKPVAGARLRLKAVSETKAIEAISDSEGRFEFRSVEPGNYEISATARGFVETKRVLTVGEDGVLIVDLHFTSLAPRAETLNVTADVRPVDIQHPDPALQINVREDILDANPGRPGAPVSIPGIPIETASGGLKAPQYFAPGVAGDHGEPIGQFLQVGRYLVPNNLSANAHGNGYADPNIMVPAIIETVQTDGGAFNVREGDHSVDLAAVYGFRQRLEPAGTLTGDNRDLDLVAGWSPGDPVVRAWVAVQASYGNGFLDSLEHRQQYKVNGFRVFAAGRHEITLFGIEYYGQSKIPGLVPIDVPNLHDTIDRRQRDQTHTGEIAVNDVWHLTPASELQLSGLFRIYNLSLYSNFGDGLIRQSEFRTVGGGNATYIRKVNQWLSIMAGADYFREAPRRLDLDQYESTDPAIYGAFQKITANNVTMNFVTPYIAIEGRLAPWLHFNLGWRRDQIDFQNTDLLAPANSYQKWVGVNAPKATISILPPERSALPSIAFSYGQTFFTNDPRIGNGTTQSTPVSRAHAYQIVVSKTVFGADLRVTLGRITQEQSLAKIDPDTGLQFDEGPSRNWYITVAARHFFKGGFVQASLSKADARDLSDGTPVPEAPRLIYDLLGTLDRLPFQLHARAEYEEVGRKPLGDGFVSLPVREFRGAIARRFGDRIQIGMNFQIASGYTGQTTEVLALPGEGDPFERVTGVYLPSHATLSFSYRFGRAKQP